MAQPSRKKRGGNRNTGNHRPADPLFGPHPEDDDALGHAWACTEEPSKAEIPHRHLAEKPELRSVATRALQDLLWQHHASPEARAAVEHTAYHLIQAGADPDTLNTKLLPDSASTQKGNLAEVVLAEYVGRTTELQIPIYRLRYNPNVNQSMKGDDVLAFDLKSSPVRILVGEAKFRASPSKQTLEEIAKALQSSKESGLPASIPFVAQILRQEGNHQAAEALYQLPVTFARRRVRVHYVGFVMGDHRSYTAVQRHSEPTDEYLTMLSMSVSDPDGFTRACYQGDEG